MNNFLLKEPMKRFAFCVFRDQRMNAWSKWRGESFWSKFRRQNIPRDAPNERDEDTMIRRGRDDSLVWKSASWEVSFWRRNQIPSSLWSCQQVSANNGRHGGISEIDSKRKSIKEREDWIPDWNYRSFNQTDLLNAIVNLPLGADGSIVCSKRRSHDHH